MSDVKINGHSQRIAWRFAPDLVEARLRAILSQPAPFAGEEFGGFHALRAAMCGAVFNGGKRLRSQLVLETAGVAGGQNFDAQSALPAACAIELIHAYSLVHDDLPAMDNADTRRGQPSCHKQWGEATAILAGDGLLTLAFETVADCARPRRGVQILARAAGECGMVGGQAIDMDWSSRAANVSGEALLQMHAGKTGALIKLAAQLGALCGGANEIQSAALANYGAHLGRAFQIADDVLDVAGDPQITGKAASDNANNKFTAPAIFGLEQAREMARQSAHNSVASLEIFGDEANVLRDVARFVVEREK